MAQIRQKGHDDVRSRRNHRVHNGLDFISSHQHLWIVVNQAWKLYAPSCTAVRKTVHTWAILRRTLYRAQQALEKLIPSYRNPIQEYLVSSFEFPKRLKSLVIIPPPPTPYNKSIARVNNRNGAILPPPLFTVRVSFQIKNNNNKLKKVIAIGNSRCRRKFSALQQLAAWVLCCHPGHCAREIWIWSNLQCNGREALIAN